MSKRANVILSVLFLAFIGLFFLMNLVIPDKEMSEQENRYLQTLPTFSAENLFSGKYMKEFESYCSDQFPLRDGWIRLKARMELLQGKGANNGIYLCEQERLLEPFISPGASELSRRAAAVREMAANTDIPVTLGLIPGAEDIYSDLLPEGVKNDSEAAAIQTVYEAASVNTVNIYDTLREQSESDIYYRTDHHWTSLGAYWGSVAVLEALGLPASPPEAYTPETVSDSFCGTAYSSSGFFWVTPDRMQRFAPAPDSLTVTKYQGETEIPVSLYDESALNTKDKYRFFLGGNTPRVVLRNADSDGQKLLIIRDSYSDSLVPFLTDSFSEIHLLDLRYYRASLSEYIEQNAIDQALILYSVKNFCTDTNLALLTR